MGRLTQMVEFLNADPKRLQELKIIGAFTHFDIRQNDMDERRKYRKNEAKKN